MDDLISREVAKAAIRSKFQNVVDRCEINEVLNELPVVDAVLVVRCKDCQHRGSNKICVKLWVGTKDSFFCAFGERRDNK